MISVEYVAGFFDGEGCISLFDRGTRVILQGCFQPAIFEALKARWGGHVGFCKPVPGNRPKARWEVTGETARRFLADILPFLIEKREQAELALAVAQGHLSWEAGTETVKRLKRVEHDYEGIASRPGRGGARISGNHG